MANWSSCTGRPFQQARELQDRWDSCMGGRPLKMEVNNADIWGVPLRHPQPTDVGPGRDAIGAFPGKPLCFLQGSHQQETLSVGRQSEHAGESDSDINGSGSHQGKGWEYSSPLAGSRGRFQVSHTPDSWTKIVGERESDIRVSSDGQFFFTSR